MANKRQGFDPYSTISRGTWPKGSYNSELTAQHRTPITTDSEYKKLRELRELYYFNTKEKRTKKKQKGKITNLLRNFCQIFDEISCRNFQKSVDFPSKNHFLGHMILKIFM